MRCHDYHVVYSMSADHANVYDLARLHLGSDPQFDREDARFKFGSEVNTFGSQIILNVPLSTKTVADYIRSNPILAKMLDFVADE